MRSIRTPHTNTGDGPRMGRQAARSRPHAGPRAARLALLALVATLVLGAGVSPAFAAAPAWRLDSLANSTAAPGSAIEYQLQITNLGDGPADGVTPLTLTITLPAGLSFSTIGGGWSCSGTPVVTCTEPSSNLSPHEFIQPVVTVNVVPNASGTLTTSFSLSGGDPSNPTASTVDSTVITSEAPRFGVDAFDGQVTADAAGDPYTQAGGHPYAASTSIDFNTETNPNPFIGPLWPVAQAKDALVGLPPGFVVDTAGVAQCTQQDLANSSLPLCPPASQVGTTLIRLSAALFGASDLLGPLPVFNLVPPPGVPAELGFNVLGSIVIIKGGVRSGGDYGLSASATNIPEGLALIGTDLTLWGTPADPSHDLERTCPGQAVPGFVAPVGPSCKTEAPRVALIRNPTTCTAPGEGLLTTLRTDSWTDPGTKVSSSFISHNPPGYPAPPDQRGAAQGPTGCDKVPFAATLAAAPTAPVQANSSAGLVVDLSLPQSSDPSSVGEADLKKTVVTFPQGVRLSPSSAGGLGACSPAQIGLLGTGFPEPNTIHFDESEPSCPDSSKLGSMTIETPLLERPMSGTVYLATPHENPFGSLVAIYLVAKGPGVTIKLPGRVDLDPGTGQITTTFDDNPQLPFSNLHLQLDSGPRAALVMPPACGTYTTRSQLTSWSGKTVESDSSFSVSEGPGGAPCGSGPFAPPFNAGATNPVAGGFSPFTLRLQRSDDEGELGALRTLSLPPGLLADAAAVPVRCTIAQADAASCPAASHIGTVTVGAGAGSDPFYVSGDIYLMGQLRSGPFKGDPFGLAVVVHAMAGPFDLGSVVVKAGIQIHDDGSISTNTEPFPSILQGIPLQLRDVRVNLDRPGFVFNPTNCEPLSIAGAILGREGTVANVSSHFQVTDCAALKFGPKFSVSTGGKTSKANGASFHVHLTSNEGPHGTGGGESNIAKVDVQLPVALPARLTTLQKACTAAQFASNPAGCPAASFVGSATAHTPILASPLSGPAILVSHGGQAFPDLVLVLQGEGVRLNITGHTQIKKGITFSHFETVPDAPVASFDLTLPQGSHSALTTDIPGRNLCTTIRTVTVTKRVTRRVHGHTRRVTVKAKKAVAASLLMPTTITAQNGAVIHQNTKIAVTGCTTVKTKAKVRKTKGHKR
jgi:uncharacterized repeat protein (TIGR01451 family)